MNFGKWQNEKGTGFCAVLYGAWNVHYDAASESCLGRDRAGGAAFGGVPAVLLLEYKSYGCVRSDLQLDSACAASRSGRSPYREKNKEPISSKLESSLYFLLCMSELIMHALRVLTLSRMCKRTFSWIRLLFLL